MIYATRSILTRFVASGSSSQDPFGGAVHYWEPINSIYEFDIEVVNPRVDPTFAFMTVDHALALWGPL